ncbi:histidine phosphatase family protein [Heyndrickxia sp. NPDC080065]|uniref:histidine phosphatase family protein n=1 Tax=Heyndrickxia sp. NPDC080065 TaxID=3390568 RepID=UPI003CFC6261
MTKICIVRHGETDWNVLGKIQGRTDIPLNTTGIRQAKECGEFLKTSKWDVIITSPLKRAKQTAEIINQYLRVPLVEMNEFIERSFGDAEGMDAEERMSAYPDKNYPNQEDSISLEKRLMAGINEINQRYRDSNVLLVTHGAVIHSILSTLSNREIYSGKEPLLNACISNIHFEQEKWKVKEFNKVSHLSQYNRIGQK